MAIKGRISFNLMYGSLIDQLVKCFKYNLLSESEPKGDKRFIKGNSEIKGNKQVRTINFK